jgi:hypothetical protein
MSTPTDMADLIRNRLLTEPAAGELAVLCDLTHIDVIVYRQQSLQQAVDAAVGKASGCAITIEWSGFRTLDEDSEDPDLAESYTISVWSKPVIDGGNRPAELVLKSIILRMWQWVPGGGHFLRRAVPKNGGVTPSKSYLIYDCEVVTPIYLKN